VQCFETFRGFIRKIYATTMNGKGREGTYNFFSHDDHWGRQPGTGRSEQAGSCPPPCHLLAPPMTIHPAVELFFSRKYNASEIQL